MNYRYRNGTKVAVMSYGSAENRPYLNKVGVVVDSYIKEVPDEGWTIDREFNKVKMDDGVVVAIETYRLELA